MSHEPDLKQIQKEYHGSLRSYIIGFIASLVLTVLAFGVAITKPLIGRTFIFTIVALALIQAGFQLRYFLKLGYEAKPRWETLIFCFMFLILIVIAIGSLWIMIDLNDRLMFDMSNM
ncbi:MAG: cytochrome o ubiquinol oxidase subunit IV [Chlamydiales bacterium]